MRRSRLAFRKRICFSPFEEYARGQADRLQESSDWQLAHDEQVRRTADILDVGYMESFMDWKLLYHDRGAMIGLANDITQEQIREIRFVAEENQVALQRRTAKDEAQSKRPLASATRVASPGGTRRPNNCPLFSHGRPQE